MGVFRIVLMGTGAALTSVAAAGAADLPVRKAAPVEYVRICDAYGEGFFFIPGTQTCLRLGGRVRADYAYVPRQWVYDQATALPLVYGKLDDISVRNSGDTGSVKVVAGPDETVFDPASTAGKIARSQHTVGWEARARIDFDARTQTAWGVVRTVASLRLARTTGVLGVASGAENASASPTLESAYIQFAGFTFGAARDNFSFMPSRMYGAGHWSSFANGAKQLAYTHVFGGGLSATIALQDPIDTTVGGFDYTMTVGSISANQWGTRSPGVVANLPQLNANLQWQQGWGEVFVAGAVRRIDIASTSKAGSNDPNFVNNGLVDRFRANATAWALGAGLKFNLPMIAAGDALWLTAAYADGMTEYTTNWSSFKSSAYRRDVGGLQINHPSYLIYGSDQSYDPNRIETLKSWNVAALFDHYWSPQWRSTLMGSYGQIKSGSAKTCAAFTSADTLTGSGTFKSAAPTFNGDGDGLGSTSANGCFGDATVWNVGKQLAWLPTRNMEIGVEVLYARTSFDLPANGSGVGTSTSSSNVTTNRSWLGCLDDARYGQSARTCSWGNFTGRLRVERTF